jgi:signal peptidase II
MMKARRQLFGVFAAVASITMLLSQLSSHLVNRNIPLGETVVVTEWLHFTHIRNLGGVFGVMQGHGWLFALLSLVLIGALIVYLLRARQVHAHEFLFFGFIAGGGMSNVLDRLIYGSVVDFINIQGIPYWFYIFNTADMMVHIGLWPLLLLSFRADRKPVQP